MITSNNVNDEDVDKDNVDDEDGVCSTSVSDVVLNELLNERVRGGMARGMHGVLLQR